MREAVGNGKYRLQVEFLSGKARRCTPERAGAQRASQPRSRGGSGSGPIVRPFSRRIRSGSSNPGEWDFAASGMASEMTADGSAQPILAMQSSVSPLHGLSPWDVAAFIISAHSSLICDAVTAALDIAGADAKATSWAKRPTIAPKSSIRESQRLTIKY